jgi:hypothetical protein
MINPLITFCVAFLGLFTIISPYVRAQTAPSSSSTPIERIKTQQIEAGPVRHAALTSQQIARIQKLQASLADVDNSPIEKWLDDFKRDENPDREIAVFEAITQAYQTFCSAQQRTLPQKREAYGLLLERSGTTDEDALRNYQLKTLSVNDAKEVLSYYRKAAAPIQIYQK